MVKIPFRKSKEEKDIERKIRTRKAKNMLQNYTNNLEKLQKRIFDLGRQAAKINDSRLMRRQSSKYLALESRINQAKKLMILIEEAEAQKELVNISSSFITFSKDVVDSIKEGPGIKDLGKMQIDFEKAMANAESMEEALSTVVDSASENILTSGEFDDQKVDEVSKMFEGEAGVEESELDSKIDERMKEVEDMMKK